MAARPALTPQSFLEFIFKPSKSVKPVGLRKTKLKGLKGGRTKPRLNAFNNMPAEKQEVLKRSGMLDKFLKGETSYTDAKRALRVRAQSSGIVGPVRRKYPSNIPPANKDSRKPDAEFDSYHAAYRHLNKLNTSVRKNRHTIASNVGDMTDAQRRAVLNIGSETELRTLAMSKNGKWMAALGEDEERNLLWYH